ncbi:hypothetical protein A9Q74_00400 [Colwellia sp. 39_35_sub15_T18]|nr:hypothetical protein A9Q74_00400 [Colwellia sp. 39_35_sub15_T18]
MKTAIIIIDVQNALFEKNPKPYESDDVIDRINFVSEQARKAGAPIFFIQHEHPEFLGYGSESWNLHSKLKALDSDFKIRKTEGNCFVRTDLDAQLKSKNITDLVICGYASEFCIDSTTRSAAQSGYTVQLVSDSHTTDDKEHLSAEKIRNHHNETLSMSPQITIIKSGDIKF